jgi:hypothetical protein
MSFEIAGLPLHPLLVHGVVVLLPLAAGAVVLHAAWPAARRRLGVVTPLLAGICLVLAPITVQAGEALAAQVGMTPKIAHHEQLANMLLPWATALFVVALGEWVWFRFVAPAMASASAPAPASARTGPVAAMSGLAGSAGSAAPADSPSAADVSRRELLIRAAVLLLAVAVAFGTVVVVFRAGDAGARAVWEGVGG